MGLHCSGYPHEVVGIYKKGRCKVRNKVEIVYAYQEGG